MTELNMDTIRAALPTGPSQWWVAAQVALGALIGWILAPSLWLAVGPRAWLCLVLARASAESQWRTDVMGRDNEYGVLQFSPVGASFVGWPVVEEDWRGSPFWSGWAAARHTVGRLSAEARWWLLAVPVYRFAVFSRSYRYGPTVSLDGAWAEARAERHYFPAWFGFSFLTLAPVVLVLGYLFATEDD